MVKIVPNPDRPGPGGAPSLRIESRSGAMTSYDYRENLSVCTAPFPVEAKQPLRVEFCWPGKRRESQTVRRHPEGSGSFPSR